MSARVCLCLCLCVRAFVRGGWGAEERVRPNAHSRALQLAPLKVVCIPKERSVYRAMPSARRRSASNRPSASPRGASVVASHGRSPCDLARDCDRASTHTNARSEGTRVRTHTRRPEHVRSAAQPSPAQPSPAQRNTAVQHSAARAFAESDHGCQNALAWFTPKKALVALSERHATCNMHPATCNRAVWLQLCPSGTSSSSLQLQHRCDDVSHIVHRHSHESSGGAPYFFL